MNEKKVILLSVLILLLGLISYNLGPGITGSATGCSATMFSLNKNTVMERTENNLMGTITVTIKPGSCGIKNIVQLYSVNSGREERVTGATLSVCKYSKCKDKVTKIFRFPNNVVPGFVSEQKFLFRGTDDSGKVIKSPQFTIINSDKLTAAVRR